ncbi:MAG: hypothetical protein JXA19_01430 [Anaerolineales bacterium]|nr:hypothetical protein [Anaerolineales bacterium]
MFQTEKPGNYQQHSLLKSPILLGALGITSLFKSFGFFHTLPWSLIVQATVILLMTTGVELVLRSKSLTIKMIGGIVFIILMGSMVAYLIFLPGNSATSPLLEPDRLQVRNIWSLRQNSKNADVSIIWPPGEGTLNSLSPDNNYTIFGSVMYADTIHFNVDRDSSENVIIDLSTSDPGNFSLSTLNADWANNYWQIWLHPALKYRLDFRTSTGHYDFYLQDIFVEYLNLKTGSGNINLYLPDSNLDAELQIGSGRVVVELPLISSVYIEVRNNTGTIQSSGLHQETISDNLELYTTERYVPGNNINVHIILDKGTLILKR